MSIVAEEQFPIPASDFDKESQHKQNLVRALGRRFDPGECKLFRKSNDKLLEYPMIVVGVVDWDVELQVVAIDASLEFGLMIMCSDVNLQKYCDFLHNIATACKNNATNNLIKYFIE